MFTIKLLVVKKYLDSIYVFLLKYLLIKILEVIKTYKIGTVMQKRGCKNHAISGFRK